MSPRRPIALVSCLRSAASCALMSLCKSATRDRSSSKTVLPCVRSTNCCDWFTLPDVRAAISGSAISVSQTCHWSCTLGDLTPQSTDTSPARLRIWARSCVVAARPLLNGSSNLVSLVITKPRSPVS